MMGTLPVRSGCLEQPLQADLSAQPTARIRLIRTIVPEQFLR